MLSASGQLLSEVCKLVAGDLTPGRGLLIRSEPSTQQSHTEQVTSVSLNKRETPNCTEDSHFRGDALPLSDSSEYSPKFYTSPPTSQSSPIPNHTKSPTQKIPSTQYDDDPTVNEVSVTEENQRNTISNSSSSSTVCAGELSSSLGKQQNFNSAHEPKAAVDKLASQSGVQGKTNAIVGLGNEPFFSQAGSDVATGTQDRTFSSSVFPTGKSSNTSGYGSIASGSSVSTVPNGAGYIDQLHRTSPPPAEHTTGHGDNGVVRRTSREVLHPVQESETSCSSDIVVAVPAIPRRIGLVFGSDSYV